MSQVLPTCLASPDIEFRKPNVPSGPARKIRVIQMTNAITAMVTTNATIAIMTHFSNGFNGLVGSSDIAAR